MKKIMVIGAHPDDCDVYCGGIALKYIKCGFKVKFLSVTNGSKGHQTMSSDELVKRRAKETEAVAELTGIEYSVWEDVEDGELEATLKNRMRLVKEIRQFNPDIIFCNRPNDYHPDHRNTSILVQDASYLLIVPLFCPDTPALSSSPVIMHWFDNFKNPVFKPDVVIDIDDVIEEKFEMLNCHESQVYEWLPYTEGELEGIPYGKAERLEWLKYPKAPKTGNELDNMSLSAHRIGSLSEMREAARTVLFRKNLIEKYGDKGKNIIFSEAYAVSEYGRPLTRELRKELFPF